MTTDQFQLDMFGEPRRTGDDKPKRDSVNKLRASKGQVEAPKPTVEFKGNTTYYGNGPIIGGLGFQEDEPYTPVSVEGKVYRLQIFDMNLMAWVPCPPEQYEDMTRRVRRYVHGDRSIERQFHVTNEPHRPKVFLEEDVYDAPFWYGEEDDDE